MKIIVCGAGPVGTGIARQLASEDNDVIIIDNNPDAIQKINDTLDCSALIGQPSHPTVLESAGGHDTEMIIAVTTSDETNMVISQVAHSLFNIPIKIARIRHQNYLQPIWKDLYRHDHLPIDHIISPEKEVANAIINRLHVPGAMDSIAFADKRLKVIEVRIFEDCPALNQQICRLESSMPHLSLGVIGIHRDDELIIPEPSDRIQAGDEVFFITETQDVRQVMALLGHQEKEARRVMIIGGGNIGLFIAESLEGEDHDINAKLIELNKERAQYIAERLINSRATVIHGSALDQEILHEANVANTETVIAVTNNDEVNILSALLAKRYGTQRAFSLVNKGRAYGPLISSLGIDVTINPREMTVSSILQHTRRGKVRSAHSICNGQGELIETEAVPHSAIIGTSINDLSLPNGIRIVAIYRKEEVLIPNSKTIIQEHDRIVIICKVNMLKKLDDIFSSRLDYF